MRPQVRMSQAGIWFLVMLVGLVVAAFFVGRYAARDLSAPRQSKLASALQAFRAGYDDTAVALLTPLAKDGNPKAQYWLADIYQNGLGVKPNIARAVELLGKSAAQRFVPAETRLGEIYLQGDQTLQDSAKARQYLHESAIDGDSTAQRELGDVYALGLGVPRDPVQAYAWYENAVIHGDGLAQHQRDDLVTRMSPDEIAKAQHMAKEIAGQVKPRTSEHPA